MENKNVNFTNVAYLARNIGDILFYEKEIESLNKENILDIFVDTDGSFHYQVTDSYFNQLVEVDPNFIRKISSFKDICLSKGVDEKIYDLYFRKI